MPRLKLLLALLILFTAAGCELAQVPQPSPTPPEDPTIAPTPELLPTDTLAPTLTPPPQIATEPPTETLIPTETFTPAPTPEPYATYIIQDGDTLYFIIQQPPFFYRDLRVADEVVALNDNIMSLDRLPPAGSSILIPYPTGTPTPEGFELTAQAQPVQQQIALPFDAEIIQVEVREGETILGIASRNATNLTILATLNPQLRFIGCDFSNPSGGPDCSVSIVVGEPINVPALTATPTLSPTFSGNETATLTPTYRAPMVIFPPQDASAPPRAFQLQWVSAGALLPNEVYLVQIEDETSGATHTDITRSTSYELPEELIPTDGEAHTIRWRVTIAAPNQAGAYAFISPEGQWRTFFWQSR